MGALQSFFGSRLPSEIVIDLANAVPDANDAEAVELFNAINELLAQGQGLLVELDQYQGNADLIREALSSPSDMEKGRNAFVASLPNVDLIKRFYEYSRELSVWFPRLLNVLLNTPDLEQQQVRVEG